MTEEEIVIKVCDIMGVKYSHYDNHKMTKDYFRHFVLKSIPKIVVYSGMSPWEFAILEDMSIVTLNSMINETVLDAVKTTKIEIKYNEYIKGIIKEYETIIEAENFLKDNNCSDVINNQNKKINWM
jgi:hypothetical protein